MTDSHEPWNERLSAWWLDEVAGDPAYADEVLPLTLDHLRPAAGATYLDLGCGDGRLMTAIVAAGARAVGVDASVRLSSRARGSGPVVVGLLPDLGFLRDSIVDGVVVVLVLEHLPATGSLFDEAARVTRPGGCLVVVLNHPLITAPGSGPFVDPEDGEVLWRWGRYLEAGSTDEPTSAGSVRFHHHPLGDLLSMAATAGWSLDEMGEVGVGPARAAIDPVLAAQGQVPRLLAARWSLGGRP